MTGAAVTDLVAQRDADLERIRGWLEEGLKTHQIAERLGVVESYARRLLRVLEMRGEATPVCGVWLPAVIG
jgi:DNA-binding transcriptional regulator LsrR (DeoR family)